MISRETISRILDTVHIEEVVSDFLTLKKRGSNYISLCPFHNEKTPSFNVNPGRNIYKCFGCGKGGDAVNFMMEHEKMNYPEALRYLAKKYNIEIEEVYKENAEEEEKQQSERESLYVVCSFAQKYFSEILLSTNEGKSIGLSYFKERGFTDETIEKFQLGYAPENKTAFTDAALQAGYQLDYLIKAGLVIKSENTFSSEQQTTNNKLQTSTFDRFAGRIIFPIHGVTGRVIGFGGRALRKDAKAKYINSPETDIYHKGNILYGMSLARKIISSEDNCFLVEGYTDVISLHQAGIENVVASSGTSLTVEQIRLIRRYTSNITIMYDGDAAGIEASFRGIDLVLEEGMNVRVILFPDKEDPDSFAKKSSEDELRNFIKENTTDFIRFKTQLLFTEVKDDPIKKSELIRQIVESIALIPSSVTRTIFIQECSKIMKMDEQVLFNELNKALRKRFARKGNEINIEEQIKLPVEAMPQPIETQTDTTEHHEKEIIRLLLNYGNSLIEYEEEEPDDDTTKTSEQTDKTKMVKYSVSVAKLIMEHLAADDICFENETYQKIFDEIITNVKNGNIISRDYFIHHENLSFSQTAIDLTTFPYSLSKWQDRHGIVVQREEDILRKAVENAIYSLKLKKIFKMISEIEKQLMIATSEEEEMNLIAEKKHLDDAKNIFSKKLRWIILR
ncbi:MAG: DNA primase [Bacteroidota bacterium]